MKKILIALALSLSLFGSVANAQTVKPVDQTSIQAQIDVLVKRLQLLQQLLRQRVEIAELKLQAKTQTQTSATPPVIIREIRTREIPVVKSVPVSKPNGREVETTELKNKIGSALQKLDVQIADAKVELALAKAAVANAPVSTHKTGCQGVRTGNGCQLSAKPIGFNVSVYVHGDVLAQLIGRKEQLNKIRTKLEDGDITTLTEEEIEFVKYISNL